MSELNADEIIEISNRTIEHYNGRAEAFFEGTHDHNLSDTITINNFADEYACQTLKKQKL